MKIDNEKLWYTKNLLSALLLPLSWLFRLVASLRRVYYSFKSNKADLNVSIVVVGNLTVGGAGKTPFVAYLAQRCISKNIKVGIISRGYKRNNTSLIEVQKDSTVQEVGDEALMLKKQVVCPVAVAANRVMAAEYLTDKYKLDAIISDDGLQHYRLPRDIEIVVVDGEREFGNARCLPAGPLREPLSRLNSVDMVICNGKNQAYEYQYYSSFAQMRRLKDDTEHKTLDDFKGLQVHAIAGIGFPKRFFAMLEDAGLKVIAHAFADHYDYSNADLQFNDDLPIIMTEKDAVKCKSFAKENIWYIPLTITPNEKLDHRLNKLLEDIN